MQAITTIYRELEKFYDDIAPQMGAHAHGTRILYTPPRKNARLMFVGIQPGGDASTVDPTWPSVNEYADPAGARNLGRKLREMVDPELLRQTVGTNLNFFRSRETDEYKRVPSHLRRRIAEFCRPRVIRIIEALEPRSICCIGISVFGDLKPTYTKTEKLRSKGNGCLICSGELASIPVIGVPHLTGSRISNVDLAIITTKLKSLLE